MEAKLTKVVLTDDNIFNHNLHLFEWMPDSDNGITKKQHAGFTICPIWKKVDDSMKIVEVYIYPKYQPNAKHFYYIANEDGWEGVDFGQFLYEYDTVKGKNHRTESPNVWKTHWCKEHNCQSFEFYVPRNSNGFFVSTGLEKFCLNWK